MCDIFKRLVIINKNPNIFVIIWNKVARQNHIIKRIWFHTDECRRGRGVQTYITLILFILVLFFPPVNSSTSLNHTEGTFRGRKEFWLNHFSSLTFNQRCRTAARAVGGGGATTVGSQNLRLLWSPLLCEQRAEVLQLSDAGGNPAEGVEQRDDLPPAELETGSPAAGGGQSLDLSLGEQNLERRA